MYVFTIFFLLFLVGRPIVVKGISRIPGFVDYKLESVTKLKENEISILYSRVQNSIERLFWAGNQGNHQNFEKNDTSYETQGCLRWKKTKQNKFL